MSLLADWGLSMSKLQLVRAVRLLTPAADYGSVMIADVQAIACGPHEVLQFNGCLCGILCARPYVKPQATWPAQSQMQKFVRTTPARMVTTRAAARAQNSPLPAKQGGDALPASKLSNGTAKGPVQQMISWAETHGAGRGQSGAWGIGGAAGKALAYGGTLALMLGCPAFAIYM